MNEVFTIVQKNKSYKDGFVFGSGILQSNKTIREILDIFYDAWDYVINEHDAIAQEMELDKVEKKFAKFELVADIELIHVPDEKEELYTNSDALMNYIDDSVNHINGLELVHVLKITNEDNLNKRTFLKELSIYFTKGENVEIYYELTLHKYSRKVVDLVINFISEILE